MRKKKRMALKGIPPITSTGSRSQMQRIGRGRKSVDNAFQGKQFKKIVLHHSKMKTSTLEDLLAHAQDLLIKQKEVISWLPTSENLDRLNFLKKSISQLRTQLIFRKR